MKIPLKRNLLPHIEGTDIAEMYELKNEGDDNHTVVDRDVVEQLVQDLKELHTKIFRLNFAEQQKKNNDLKKIAALQERQRVIRSVYQDIARKTPQPKK